MRFKNNSYCVVEAILDPPFYNTLQHTVVEKFFKTRIHCKYIMQWHRCRFFMTAPNCCFFNWIFNLDFLGERSRSNRHAYDCSNIEGHIISLDCSNIEGHYLITDISTKPILVDILSYYRHFNKANIIKHPALSIQEETKPINIKNNMAMVFYAGLFVPMVFSPWQTVAKKPKQSLPHSNTQMWTLQAQ